MYAIVATSGRQYRVEKGGFITVDRLDAEVDTEITLDQVLIVGGEETKVGTPNVEGATVTARVVGHDKGEKVVTVKYKQRKRSRVRRGFRASRTTLEILDIKAQE
ncbi:MAG: 50S ribosomal protein L21 [Deltaproteobacteria bacterium]|nr:50S ribosomal protein L21 [Deltaproteobacteria bacterium]